MPFISLVLLALLLSSTAPGCAKAESQSAAAGASAVQSYAPDAAPAELKPAIAKADEAFARMRQAVMARLNDELSRGNTLTAFTACHDAAPEIARHVRIESGIQLGRTSHRLRNPSNRPPEWAAAHVAAHAGGPAAEAPAIVFDLGDRVGVLRPIETMAVCTSCHGPADQIASDVGEELVALYPTDKATGFREGDLRGWMWAEVPKTQ